MADPPVDRLSVPSGRLIPARAARPESRVVTHPPPARRRRRGRRCGRWPRPRRRRRRGCGAGGRRRPRRPSASAASAGLELAVGRQLVLGELGQAADGVALVDADQADALGVAADQAHVGDRGADQDAAGGREHHLVVVGHLGDGDDRAVAVARLDVDQPLAAAVLRAVLGQQRSACRSRWRRRSGGWPGRRRRWRRPCRRPRRPRPGSIPLTP